MEISGFLASWGEACMSSQHSNVTTGLSHTHLSAQPVSGDLPGRRVDTPAALTVTSAIASWTASKGNAPS